jgi:hypothetical protein
LIEFGQNDARHLGTEPGGWAGSVKRWRAETLADIRLASRDSQHLHPCDLRLATAGHREPRLLAGYADVDSAVAVSAFSGRIVGHRVLGAVAFSRHPRPVNAIPGDLVLGLYGTPL